MISRIEVLRYKCLLHVKQDMGPFHVLVGPNASGKTTFLDAVAFLGDLVTRGLDAALSDRAPTFQDLLWKREGSRLEIAIELNIPEERLAKIQRRSLSVVRYETSFGQIDEAQEMGIISERVILKGPSEAAPRQWELFPFIPDVPNTLATRGAKKGTQTVINKVQNGNDNFYDETGKGWDHAFKLGPRRSALANLPEDESKFPVATWLKGLLVAGVQRIVLNSMLMRRPSPPGQPARFLPDGSNLPWVVHRLMNSSPPRFTEWLSHLRSVLPDLEGIATEERPWDKSRYLVVTYDNGVLAPSWTLSDGTLRLFALTIPAYLQDFSGVYLIEEPENDIHPRAVEALFQSLTSVYGAQVLMASHSPVILGLAEPSTVLCFAKTESGATDIVRGSEHPALREWRGEENLGVLFAGGVLG